MTTTTLVALDHKKLTKDIDGISVRSQQECLLVRQQREHAYQATWAWQFAVAHHRAR